MEAKSQRIESLDALRGLTILVMLPVNAGLDFAQGPWWLKHSPGPGLRLADFVMPAFLIALGLSASLSLGRRLAKDGLGRTVGHALLRYAILFAMGSIGFFLVWKQSAWEVLQMLGLTGLFAFPFLFLPPLPRIVSAVAVAGIVEILRKPFFASAYSAWYESGLGGPAGTFALGSLVILASALGELFIILPWKRRCLAFAAVGLVLVAGGLAFSQWQSPDKHLLTPAFLCDTTGAACLVFALLEPLCQRFGDLPIVGFLGRNPLFAYIGSGILILPVRGFLPDAAAPLTAWLCIIGVSLVTIGLSLVLDRRKIWIRL